MALYKRQEKMMSDTAKMREDSCEGLRGHRASIGVRSPRQSRMARGSRMERPGQETGVAGSSSRRTLGDDEEEDKPVGAIQVRISCNSNINWATPNYNQKDEDCIEIHDEQASPPKPQLITYTIDSSPPSSQEKSVTNLFKSIKL